VGERRPAIGAVYRAGAAVDPDALVACMRHGLRQAFSPDDLALGLAPTLVAV